MLKKLKMALGMMYKKKNKYNLDEYKLNRWSKKVRLFYGNRCYRCKSRKNLQAHHLKPKSLYPKLAYSIKNGRPLCRYCHINSPDSIHSLIPLHKCNERTFNLWLKKTKPRYTKNTSFSFKPLFIFFSVIIFVFYFINVVK